jgi:hypothetical protein
MLLPPLKLLRLPMLLLDPMPGVLKEREPLLQLLLARFELPLKPLDPSKPLLVLIPELLLKLRVIPDIEPLGNTRAESILENEPEGAWRMAWSMLFRKATS